LAGKYDGALSPASKACSRRVIEMRSQNFEHEPEHALKNVEPWVSSSLSKHVKHLTSRAAFLNLPDPSDSQLE
jgi:hypothetical protein